MKDIPILFSGTMVRAILEGRKTMTRRVVKPQPNCLNGKFEFSGTQEGAWPEPNVWLALTPSGRFGTITPPYFKCPYGNVGDRMWVRETFGYGSGYNHKPRKLFYKCSCHDVPAAYCCDWGPDDPSFGYIAPDDRWRPSIHMPRLASRITLEVTAVRVERLQEITEEDARCEGCLPVVEVDGSITCGTRKISFSKLWDSINADRPKLPKDVNSKRYASVKRWLEKHPPCAWDDNPWVWVVEFRRIDK